MALEAVTRELELVVVRALGPFGSAGLGLEHALAAEGADGTVLAQLIDARVDLAAHGVVGHGDKAANARQPRSPGNGVER